MRRVMSGAAEVARYDYDYERRRIGKTQNQGVSWQEYEYDGTRVVNEYQRGLNEAGTVSRVSSARYEYGVDLVRGTFGTSTPTSLWYYSDALGSVTALSNASGTIQTAYGYNAWGERTVGSDWGGVVSPLNNLNAIGYTGQFFDNETGLMPLGNGERYYSASLGRFTQQDSFSGMLDEAMSLNRYGYANGNPLRFIDPSGHDGEESQAWKDTKAVARSAWNSVKELGYIAHDLAVLGMPLGGIGVAVGAVELKSAPARQYQALKQQYGDDWIGTGLAVAITARDTSFGIVTFGVGPMAVSYYETYKDYQAGRINQGEMEERLWEIAGGGVANAVMSSAGSKLAGKGWTGRAKAPTETITEKPTTAEVGKQQELPGMEGHRRGQAELPGMEGHRRRGVSEVGESPATDYSRQRNLPFEGAEPEQLRLPFEENSASPNEINFSQRTVSENVSNYVRDMKEGNWNWRPDNIIRVMKVNGKLISYDNRRVLAARLAGLKSIPIQTVNPDDIMPNSKKAWKEAFKLRRNDPRNKAAGGAVPEEGLNDNPSIVPKEE